MFIKSSAAMKPALAMFRIAALNALVIAVPVLAMAGDSDHNHGHPFKPTLDGIHNYESSCYAHSTTPLQSRTRRFVG